MSQIIAHTLFSRIEVHPGGNITVELETYSHEHHSTNRAAAAKLVRDVLGAGYVIRAYLGKVNVRRSDGYDSTRNRYAVTYPAPTPVCVGRWVMLTNGDKERTGLVIGFHTDEHSGVRMATVDWRGGQINAWPLALLTSIGA